MRVALAIVFIIVTLGLLRQKPKAAFPTLMLYLAGVVCLTMLIRQPMPIRRMNLMPFGTVQEAMKLGESRLFANIEKVKPTYLEELVLNMLLFMPLGYLMPIICKKVDCWWKATLIGLAMSLIIETVQWLLSLGYADVDDLISNTVGTFLGWFCYWFFLKRKAEQPLF